jgi:hypothetical protein
MKGLLGIAFLTLVAASSANAYTGFGMCNFGRETISNIVCYGPVILKDTTVSGNMKVAGSLKADNATIGSITVDGTVSIESSRVKGSTNIVGTLSASGVEFMKDVSIVSDTVTLNNSKLDGSLKVTSEQTKPKLVLECGTIIAGNVTFDSKSGVVSMTGDAAVQGKIINGSQEFIQKKCS